MPLCIKGQVLTEVPACVTELTRQCPSLLHSAEELKSGSVVTVGPEKLLYVNQREYAVVKPDDNHIDVIGTNDATTCHIVILRNTGSGVTAMCHSDGTDLQEGLSRMLQTVNQLSTGSPEGRTELHVVGGFLDPREESKKLTEKLLERFHNFGDLIHLQTACVTDLNDMLRNDVHFPVIYGLAVEVKTGRIFPATFPDLGPDMDVRSATNFAGCKTLSDVYDSSRHELVIGPFRWKPWPEIDTFLGMPDSAIRQYLSTSPEQEPENFEDHVRRSLRVLRDHPEPHMTLFPGNRPRRYRKQPDGRWQRQATS